MGIFGKGLRFVLKDFSCWTSTHGVPHIGMANSVWLRAFWIVVVISCLFGFIWQFQTLLFKYLAYTVNTETKLKFTERVFPTVTLCHLNPWKKNQTGDADVNMADLINTYNSFDSASNMWDFEAGLSGKRQQKATEWTALYSERLLALSKTQPVAYSYDDLVISCTYNAKTCNTTDFVDHSDPTYGNCLKFNSEAIYKSSRAGPLYGLRMVIRSDQGNYLPWTETAGVVIVIHGQNELAYPDVLGYFAPPGTASSMGVRFLSTTRMPDPYGTCTTQEKLETDQFSGTYAVEACFRSCLQSKLIAECGCYDPAYPHANDTTTPSCAIPDPALAKVKLLCIEGIANDDEKFNVIRDCECPQPCQVETYSVTVSTAQWPSEAYTPSECNGNVSVTSSGKWNSTALCVDWYKSNTLLVEIYYERMNYQVLTESPAYSIVNLVSDVGGQVGLFLGMSIISLLEFIFLIFLVCGYCSTHKRRKVEMEDLDEEKRKEQERRAKLESRAKKHEKRAKRTESNGIYNGSEDPVPPTVTDT